MDEPSSRPNLAAVATVALSLALGAAVVAPALAEAATHDTHASPNGQLILIKVDASKKYGQILVNASGKTLYFLTAETATSLKCTGGCLGAWPPLLTKGKPQAGKGIVTKELGTVKRGSSLQVTYYGHPLYLYSGDKAAGQENGEGIAAFGGWWYVLSPTGSPVKAALTSSSSGSGGSGGGW